MSERIGICDKCGQRYGDIPDSVTALKVKCQVCDGVVAIPPLAVPTESSPVPPPASPEAPAASVSPTPPPAKSSSVPGTDKPLAAPLGDSRPKVARPDKAKSIDRGVAAPPEPEAPTKAILPKEAAPKVAKPIVPPKPVIPVKPVAQKVVPVKPIGKASTPVKPPKAAVAKPVVPVKPIAKAVPKPAAPQAPAAKVKPKPVADVKPQPTAKVEPKPAAKAPAPAKKTAAPPQEAKKPSAAEIIAKAKAKRAAKPAADAPPPQKASAADIIAKAKAKRAAEATPAKKESAADIIAKAKAKRAQPTGAAKASATAKATKTAAPSTGRDSRLPKPSGSRRPSGGSKRSGSKSSRRRRQEDEVVEKSKAPMLILGVLVLGGIGAGAWWALRPSAEPVLEGETVEAPTANSAGEAPLGAATNSVPEGNEVIPVAVDEGTEVAPAEAVDNTDATSADTSDAAQNPAAEEDAAMAATPAPTPSPSPAPGKEWVVPAIGEPVSTRGVTDYKLIQLELVPALPKWSGTTDEEWVEIQDDLLLFLDDSGAQSNRAGLRLVNDFPRGAYPAIVNAMMQINFDDKEGMYVASTLNELLTKIGNGTNYGWTSVSGLEPGSEEWAKAALLDKKICGTWHSNWVNKYADSDSAWAGFTSSAADIKAAKDKAKAEKAAADSAGVVGPEEDIFD